MKKMLLVLIWIRGGVIFDPKKLIDECQLVNNEKLCCVKENKLAECDKYKIFTRGDYLIYKVNTNEFKNKILYDKYHLCAFTGLVENKDSGEERIICSVLLDKNENSLVKINGYLKTNNLITLLLYPKDLDLSNKENILKNKNKAKEVHKIEVELK